MKKFILSVAMLLSLSDLGAVIFPTPLQEGDKIAILAPAGHVRPERVEGAAEVIRDLGYEPVIYPTVYLRNGQYSGTDAERLEDLRDAFLDPEIRAILCARGGYGLVHIMDSVAALPLRSDPKWVIGFSDVSALHAVMASKGIASIHASMAQHIARGMEEEENVFLFDILTGSLPSYTFPSDSRNHIGRAEGKLLGGNLAVIQALINTPYDIIQPGTILFIEDVEEPIYKIERIMYQLKLAGILDNLKGLIIGRFTDYKPGENYVHMEDMFADFLSDYPDLPVVFNAPIGHVRHNMPMIESANVILEVSPELVSLSFTP